MLKKRNLEELIEISLIVENFGKKTVELHKFRNHTQAITSSSVDTKVTFAERCAKRVVYTLLTRVELNAKQNVLALIIILRQTVQILYKLSVCYYDV